MVENITRISDLPENSMQSGNMNDLGLPNSYMPMNIHPNPYGNNIQAQNHPQHNTNAVSEHNIPLYMSPEMGMPPQRLPSRDIKIDETQYLQDEQIQNNYIPKSKHTIDYIGEYEKTDKKLEKHEQEKHRERLIDVLFTEIQTPILIAILFFSFQMPILNMIFTKYLSILNLQNDDGNMNINGMVLKSIFFGILFYVVQKSSVWISEL